MRRYSLAQLEALEAIDRLGSQASAADELSVTQPTTTLRIQALEEALDSRLFERIGRKVRLTPQGRIVRNYTKRVLDLLDAMEAQLETEDPFVGQVRLGSSETVAITLLPVIIKRMQARFPKMEIALRVDQSFALADALTAGELDIAIMANPRIPMHLEAKSLVSAPVAWVSHAHLHEPGVQLTPQHLAKHTLFSMPEPSPLYERMNRWWLANGGSPLHLNINSCNSVAMLAQMVRNGLGYAVLPTSILAAEIRQGQVVASDPYGHVIAEAKTVTKHQSPTDGTGDARALLPLDLYLVYSRDHESRGIEQLHEITRKIMLESDGFTVYGTHDAIRSQPTQIEANKA